MVARLLLCGIVAFGVGVQARADLAGTVVGVADGDTLAEGPLVEQITPDGAVLNLQGSRFKLSND